MNIRKRKFKAALSLLAMVAGPLAVSGFAQAANSAKSDTTTLDKFVVTGSLIPIAAGSPAIPITVISAAEIEKSGVSTDLL